MSYINVPNKDTVRGRSHHQLCMRRKYSLHCQICRSCFLCFGFKMVTLIFKPLRLNVSSTSSVRPHTKHSVRENTLLCFSFLSHKAGVCIPAPTGTNWIQVIIVYFEYHSKYHSVNCESLKIWSCFTSSGQRVLGKIYFYEFLRFLCARIF